MKIQWTVGNIITVIVLILGVAMGYSGLRAQVNANKEAVGELRKHLAPAVSQLAINVAELTQQMKLHQHASHVHPAP